ncbi:ATP-binding cassette domain-containing protein [Frigidibacter albus]
MLVFERARIVQGDFTMEADFAVPEGARVAVIGPSGAGKSTLLAAVAGFVPLTGGRILWAGQDLAPLAPGARPLSILFQDQNLFPHLTVLQNVGLGLRPDLRLARAQQAQVAAALERVGLAGLGARLPAQCRAASRAAWRWRGRCCAPAPCCCWTSPSRRLARR